MDIKHSGELSQNPFITSNDLNETSTFAIKTIYDAHYGDVFLKIIRLTHVIGKISTNPSSILPNEKIRDLYHCGSIQFCINNQKVIKPQSVIPLENHTLLLNEASSLHAQLI